MRLAYCLLSALMILSTSVLHGESLAEGVGSEVQDFIPPATPLVACDPYFSIWSTGRTLTGVDTTHWTGKPHRLTGLVRVDGKTYRLIGTRPAGLQPLKQVSLEITPTRSVFGFEGAGLALELTFLTPLLPYDIDQLSRPVTYLLYKVRSSDGQQHEVSLFLSVSGAIAVDAASQEVEAGLASSDLVTALKVGAVDQHVLRRSGDDLRIDWGYFYLATGSTAPATFSLGAPTVLAPAFVAGELADRPLRDIAERKAGTLDAAVVLDAGSVGAEPVTRSVVMAYDDLYSIEYMMSPLRPYWRRHGLDAMGLLEESVRDQDSLIKQCVAFDEELMADLEKAGGPEYAQLAALAYRQCFAAGKFVADANGQPIQFCKENHSNGCIGTSDVFYPMAPQFLLFGPSLAKSFVVPFMEYAASDRWKFPFAPHDLGTYPKANGQVYGGGEQSEKNQMPVEESGNMLILMAAIAKLDGNADFAGLYWPQLLQWAEYLKQEGFDPDNQLCTDDFAGHLAHNVNLSAKAICGLGAFSELCKMRGEEDLAQEYRALAEDYAGRWIATADDGDHFRLAFDKPGTWSQKYNLVWDRVLGMNIFPDEVLRKEMDYYRKNQNRYGLPLDNRQSYTKLDWILWTATLTQDADDFSALVRPVYRFLMETPDRVPMTDWYQTHSGSRVGFTARPVVGGVFMQLLHDPAVWEKWSERDQTGAGGYADMPTPPVVRVIVPAADNAPSEWRYAFEEPKGGWTEVGFDDSSWESGTSGFGRTRTPGSRAKTTWDTPDIWLRRSFDLPVEATDALRLHIHHDESAEVYLNGVLAQRLRGYSTSYEDVPIRKEALAALKPTGNVLAVHCHQTQGGQYIDAGLITIEPMEQ